ncbi:MAG: hypothetical protein F6K36_19220 [Symploca sp. SIO3C6]|nr:hypothetical protein [Symploca sp. SIO3C6]
MDQRTLSGIWEASNGNRDIVVIQKGDKILVHWKEQNPYWNYAEGTVREGEDIVSMSFGGSEQKAGCISPYFDSITWGNGNSWTKKF